MYASVSTIRTSRHGSRHRKFKQVNHVVAHLDGRAFYVGAYKCVKSTELDEKRFKRLPKEVRLL